MKLPQGTRKNKWLTWWKRAGGYGVLFIFGYGSFLFFGVRIGPRPAIWRHIGTSHDLSYALKTCDIYKDNRTKLTLCMRSNFVSLVSRWGYKEVANVFEDQLTLSLETDMISARCHDITHALGQATNVLRMPIEQSLEYCTTVCQAGCHHGVIEGLMARGKDVTATSLEGACLPADLTELQRDNCYHGLGHAIAYLSKYTINSAFAQCDRATVDGRGPCGIGVLMEFFEPVEQQRRIEQLPKNIVDWCSKFLSPYDVLCQERSGVYEYIRSQTLQGGISMCQQVPEDYRFRCLLALGKYVISPLTKDETQVQKAKAYCLRVVPTSEYSACMKEIFVDLFQK